MYQYNIQWKYHSLYIHRVNEWKQLSTLTVPMAQLARWFPNTKISPISFKFEFRQSSTHFGIYLFDTVRPKCMYIKWFKSMFGHHQYGWAVFCAFLGSLWSRGWWPNGLVCFLMSSLFRHYVSDSHSPTPNTRHPPHLHHY